jgi:hypothetical protein
VIVQVSFLLVSSYMKSPLPFALLSVGGTSDEPLRSAVKVVVPATAGESASAEAIIATAVKKEARTLSLLAYAASF